MKKCISLLSVMALLITTVLTGAVFSVSADLTLNLLDGMISPVKNDGNLANWSFSNGVLVLTNEGSDVIAYRLAIDKTFAVGTEAFPTNIATQLGATCEYNIVYEVSSSSGGVLKPAVATDFYPAFGDTPVDGYMPATDAYGRSNSASFTGVYRWGDVGGLGTNQTLYAVTFYLRGKGSLTVNALQLRNDKTVDPADQGGHITAISSRAAMYQTVLNKMATINKAGQGSYTDKSWAAFTAAYAALAAVDPAVSAESKVAAAVASAQKAINFLTAKTNAPEIGELYDRVLVIGIDGMGAYDTRTSTPNIDAIANSGKTLYTHHASSVMPTMSAQNWSSMLLGVTPAKHGNNNDKCSTVKTPDYQTYPSIFKYLRNKYPQADLASFNNWMAINNGIIEHNIGVKMTQNSDDPTLAGLVCNYLKTNDPLMTYIQFDSVDHTGHALGYGSEAYLKAIRDIDVSVGAIYNELKNQGMLDNTLLMIVTDHGGKGYSHGGESDEEVYVSHYAMGKSVTPGVFANEVYTASLSSVVAVALGVSQSADYDYIIPNNYFAGYTYRGPGKDWEVDKPDFYKYRTYGGGEAVKRPMDNFVSTDTLEAQFSFDGNLSNSGSNAGITATAHGTVSYTDGYYDRGLKFNGNYVTLNNLDLGSDDFTVSFWVKNAYVASSDPVLFGNKNWNSGLNQGLLLAVNGGYKVNAASNGVRIDGTGAAAGWTALDFYSMSQRNSGFVNFTIVGNRAAKTIKTYVDFQLKASADISAFGSLSALAGCAFNIGQDGTGGYTVTADFTGDEFLYFRSAMSDHDIGNMKKYYDQAHSPDFLGDADLDGRTTTSDARAVLVESVEGTTFTKQQMINGDVDGDKCITSSDARYVTQYVAGVLKKYPAD